MDDIFLRRIIVINIAYCFSDIVFYVFTDSGISNALLIPILYITNMVYVGIPLLYSLVITKYTTYKLSGKNLTDSLFGKIIISPLIFFALLTVLTPISHSVFYIDKEAVYHRAIGAYLVPIISWGYLLSVSVLTTLRIKKTESIVEKESLTPLVTFLLFPFIATIFQLLYYGLSLAVFGFTISIISFYISRLKSQISNDDLTGLKSRAEFKRYINSVIKKNQEQDFFVIMLDFDNFKKINDTFGHIEGDKALQSASLILKNAVLETNQSFVVSRYGGDEFIIVGKYRNQDELDKLKERIYTKIAHENSCSENVFTVSLSFGLSHKPVSSYQEFCTIISDADELMYKDKQQREQARL